MQKFPTVWVDYSPDSLLDLTITYCVKNPHTICRDYNGDDCFELREGIALPEELCHRILSIATEELSDRALNNFLGIFSGTLKTRLRRVFVKGTSISDQTLSFLTNHSITNLDISGCEKLTKHALCCFQKISNSLIMLNVGACDEIFLDKELTDIKLNSHSFSNIDNKHLKHHCMGLLQGCLDDAFTNKDYKPSTVYLPHLRHFSAHDLNWVDSPILISITLNAKHLSCLDVKGCELPNGWSENDFRTVLQQMSHLVTLILCDVKNIKDFVLTVCELKQLVYLDLSNTKDQVVEYENPYKTLKMIVESLPHLTSLDISGTNLAGVRTHQRHVEKSDTLQDSKLTDIPGLESRVSKPLEFLGLLNSAHEACYRHHIPAIKISGDATEEQILLAGQIYIGREMMIQRILNDLFQRFRFGTCTNIKLALDIVMEAMRQHLKVKHIQISGSASLFYIVKGDFKDMFNIKMRRRIIKTLIDAMHYHITDVTMLRNGCLTLIHFKIPYDVFFDYERLASLLLLIVSQDDQDEFVQRIAVYLLNSLACQVDGIEKKLVGDRGAITIMLQVVAKRLLRLVCDEVMETAWSTMWNVTDETPINCSRFLENKGMDLFLGCLEAFPDKHELLRNMMGLLGNVAEVKELRSWLMKDEYLLVFSDLLQSKSDGIEVSYNAAGILSHIASDGPEPWITYNITIIQRSNVLKMMVEAIEKWNLTTKRNINYRSFKPILRLVNVDHTPEAQHWAVWALANLTTVYPEKYCHLLKEEGGLEMLKEVIQSYGYRTDANRICELASITIENCVRHENNNNSDLEDSSGEDSDTLDVT